MRILVTGGTGFLGRHMLPKLAGHELFALSRGSHASDQIPDNISWIEADLGKGLDPNCLPEKMDGVIHLAQSNHYRDFPGGAADMFKINVEVPAILAQWAQKAGVTKFVCASTGSIYEPFTGPMKENSFVSPSGYYGGSKLACEGLTLAYQSIFKVAQLRVFFLYGPGQKGMMIANIIDSIKQGKTLTLPKDNDGLEFVPTFVDDTADIFVKALLEGWSGIYNVASPQQVSFAQLLDEIGMALDKKAVIERTDTPRPTPIIPNLEKLGAKVNLQNFLTLRDGLKKTVS